MSDQLNVSIESGPEGLTLGSLRALVDGCLGLEDDARVFNAAEAPVIYLRVEPVTAGPPEIVTERHVGNPVTPHDGPSYAAMMKRPADADVASTVAKTADEYQKKWDAEHSYAEGGVIGHNSGKPKSDAAQENPAPFLTLDPQFDADLEAHIKAQLTSDEWRVVSDGTDADVILDKHGERLAIRPTEAKVLRYLEGPGIGTRSVVGRAIYNDLETIHAGHVSSALRELVVKGLVERSGTDAVDLLKSWWKITELGQQVAHALPHRA